MYQDNDEQEVVRKPITQSSSLYQMKLLQWFKQPRTFYQDMFGHPPYHYQGQIIDLWNQPEKHKRVMAVAAGGTGKTELLGGIALYFGVVLSDPLIYKYNEGLKQGPHEALILSGSLLQAKKVYGYTRTALLNSPFMNQIIGKRDIKQTDTVFKNGGVVKALPNSLTATQGQHTYVVIVDEAALVQDFQLDDCYRIVGAHNGIIIWSGTPTTYESKYVKMFEELEQKQQKGEKTEWELFTWSARECPALTTAYEEAIRTLPEDVVRIFWEGRPYPLTGTLIPRDSLIEATRGISKFKRREDWRVVFGIDWGWGDPTSLIILQTDGEKYECLEAHKWKETDFDAIHLYIEGKAKLLQPTRIFTDASDKGENLRLAKKGLPVFGIQFGKEKAMMQSRIRDLFVKNMIKIPEENFDDSKIDDFLYELRTYTWEKASGEDMVDGLLLAAKEFIPKDNNPIYIASGRPVVRKRPFMDRL